MPQNGRNALMEAATQGSFDCVKLLVDASASLDVQDKVSSLLSFIHPVEARVGSFTYSIAWKTRIVALPQNGRTALMYAASHRDSACVGYLVDAGARLDETDKVSSLPSYLHPVEEHA